MVVVATGGVSLELPIKSASALMTSSWDIFSVQVKPSKNVLFYDETGSHAGMSCAEFMLQNGTHTLELVSPHRL
jgi:hypothetical protein